MGESKVPQYSETLVPQKMGPRFTCLDQLKKDTKSTSPARETDTSSRRNPYLFRFQKNKLTHKRQVSWEGEHMPH